MQKEFLDYRPCVGIMLLNKENKVFVGKRLDNKTEAWQMPQGGVEAGEELSSAAMRELKEEIGTNNAEIITKTNEWYFYDIPDFLIPKLWGGKYRGQKQIWFLMRFLGDDSEINLTTHEQEFIEWHWADPKTLPEIIVQFKRKLYEDLLKEFAGHFN
jgi:putative (di)nucleoside polyphosphate hydrolase